MQMMWLVSMLMHLVVVIVELVVVGVGVVVVFMILGVMPISRRPNNVGHRFWSIAQGRRVAWLPILLYQYFVPSNFVTRQAIKRRCASGPAR